MINIPIDEQSSIVQPYYDGGESYKDNEKYSLIKRYKCMPEGSLSQNWCAFMVKVKAESETVIEYEGADIDISEYSRFRIFGIVPGAVNVMLYCNGELVMDKCGSGKAEYTDSDITTERNTLNSLRYIFKNAGKKDEEVCLFYLGMLNDKSLHKNPYTAEWEGCFSENPKYELFNELAVSCDALASLREKIKTEPYKSIYKDLRSKADELMLSEPEKMISKTIRRHHMAPQTTLLGAELLAVCGQIEQDKNMLKMACRYALSLACCENWCADVMETVQTVTWHHRSFDETDAVCAVCTVISLAGGLLSWHGLNLLYNAIITKGIPRIEADLMTMDYIYKCNQGIVFMKGYLFALSELMQRYPRYKLRYEEAKRLLDEMYENSFEPDGGYKEGALYWRFIVMRYLNCLYIISRCENISMADVVGNKLDKTADYGLANLDENAHILMFSDSSKNVDYGMMMPAMLYSITGKKEWAAVCGKIKKCWSVFDMLASASAEVPVINESFLKEFAYFQSVGLTVCTRGGIQFGVTGGPSNDTHCHRDKGSFLINIRGNEAVPDCCTGYDTSEHAVLGNTVSHSVAIPVINGKPCEQRIGAAFNAPITVSEYKDGVFHWKCDLSEVWDEPGVRSAEREIISVNENEFTFTDTFEFENSGAVQFRVNLSENAPIEIVPQNWIPKTEETRILLNNESQRVYQKILTSEAKKKVELVTKVKIIKKK